MWPSQNSPQPPKLPTSTVNRVFCLHGNPADIVTDMVPHLISFWFLSSPLYHSESHHAFIFKLIKNRSGPTRIWELETICLEHASTLGEIVHNSLSSTATGMPPSECSLGYQPPMFPAQEGDIDQGPSLPLSQDLEGRPLFIAQLISHHRGLMRRGDTST